MFESFLKPTLTFPTLTGSTVTFNSQYALPLKSHTIALTATQSGSGTPSPDNVRTINGYSAINIGHSGKNILDTSTLVNSSSWTYVDIYVKPNTEYTMSSNLPNNLDIQMFFKTQGGTNQYVYSGNPVTVTSSASGIIQLQYRNSNIGGGYDIQDYEWQIELGNTETAFTPYVDYDYTTITIGSTVYGGEYDARTGVLTVTHKSKVINGSENWWTTSIGGRTVFFANLTSDAKYTSTTRGQENCICSCFKNNVSATDVASGANDNQFNFASGYSGSNASGQRMMIYCSAWTSVSDAVTYFTNNNAVLVYELATPQTIQLPPCPIDTLEGVNNIWADTGDTTLQYIKLGTT